VNGRAAVVSLAARFDRLSLRERLLTTAAVLVVVAAVFNVLVLGRLESRKKELSAQLNEIVADMNDSAAGLAADRPDSTAGALARERILSRQVARASTRLDAASAGLIPPQRMVQVIRDVLAQEKGVALVSLRTLPTHSLLDGAPASAGPYVHSVEVVLDGRYLAVLDYLRALEASPWHFYWQSIDIDASHHPLSLVRVRLATVSASRDWIEL
jgi:MSHA biogenesis protein MshJ